MSAVALLAADRFRRINGQGQLVKVALKDVAVATASNLGNISEVTINNEDRQKAGNYLYGAFGRDFVSKDGVRVMIVGLTPRQWKGIVESMGIAGQMSSLETELGFSLSREGERFKARDKIAALIEPWFATKVYSEICPLFDEHAVCYGPYRTFREMVESDDDCSVDNPMMGTVTQPNIGEYLASGSPIRFADDNLETLPAPTLGQHTEQILKEELSLSDGEVGRLKSQGIVDW
jgi:2-methylfumaryl-CoA isomerase